MQVNLLWKSGRLTKNNWKSLVQKTKAVKKIVDRVPSPSVTKFLKVLGKNPQTFKNLVTAGDSLIKYTKTLTVYERPD
jgi:hypothetical protein